MSATHAMERVTVGPYSAMGLAAAGDVIAYRLRSMDPSDPERRASVATVRPNGTLVTTDEEWLRLEDLVAIRVVAPELASDHVTDGDRGSSLPRTPTSAAAATAPPSHAPPPPAAPPPPHPANVTRKPRTCARCGEEFRPTGNRQVRCTDCRRALQSAAQRARRAAKRSGKAPRGTNQTPPPEIIEARISMVREWLILCEREDISQRQAAAKLDTEANRSACRTKGLNLTTLNRWRYDYRVLIGGDASSSPAADSGVPSVPARPTAGGGDAAALPAQPAPSAPCAADRTDEGSGESATPRPPEASPSAAADLAARLRGHAERLDQVDSLLARATRALTILDEYPREDE